MTTVGMRAPDVAYVLFNLEVTAVRSLTPRMRRVTFAGVDLDEMASGGADQRVKLFFPLPGESLPVVPLGRDWYADYRALPTATRPPMRTYTVRAFDPAARTVDIEFALHGDVGVASAWALRAEPGDRLAMLGPNAQYLPVIGWEFCPRGYTDWLLLVGDESALPAIGAILETLGPQQRARVIVEVAADDCVQPLDSPAQATVTWVRRGGVPAGDPDLLLAAVRAARLPRGAPYAWLAGEAAMVRGVRRHLIRERRIPAEDICFSGYWRLGSTVE